MNVRDLEGVAELLAVDYNPDPRKGFAEAREHTEDHLRSVPQHCFVTETDTEIIGALVLHPQAEIFEIEDFHVKEIEKNREAAIKLKARLLTCLEQVESDVLCCPTVLRRLITS
jgi:hypothetical protein